MLLHGKCLKKRQFMEGYVLYPYQIYHIKNTMVLLSDSITGTTTGGGRHYHIHNCALIGPKMRLSTTIYPQDKEKMCFYLQKPSFWEQIKEHQLCKLVQNCVCCVIFIITAITNNYCSSGIEMQDSGSGNRPVPSFPQQNTPPSASKHDHLTKIHTVPKH